MFRVRMFEVRKPAPGIVQKEPAPPREVPSFTVDARDADRAKVLAREELSKAGREVRSLNISADGPNLLVAYVYAKGGA